MDQLKTFFNFTYTKVISSNTLRNKNGCFTRKNNYTFIFLFLFCSFIIFLPLPYEGRRKLWPAIASLTVVCIVTIVQFLNPNSKSMELEVKAVGGIDNCFVSLPLPLIQTLQSTRSAPLPQILALELRSPTHPPHSWFVAWSGATSSSAIEVRFLFPNSLFPFLYLFFFHSPLAQFSN